MIARASLIRPPLGYGPPDLHGPPQSENGAPAINLETHLNFHAKILENQKCLHKLRISMVPSCLRPPTQLNQRADELRQLNSLTFHIHNSFPFCANMRLVVLQKPYIRPHTPPKSSLERPASRIRRPRAEPSSAAPRGCFPNLPVPSRHSHICRCSWRSAWPVVP